MTLKNRLELQKFPKKIDKKYNNSLKNRLELQSLPKYFDPKQLDKNYHNQKFEKDNF